MVQSASADISENHIKVKSYRNGFIAMSMFKSNLSDFACVALCYQLGSGEQILNIYTQNTAKLPQTELEKLVSEKISCIFVTLLKLLTFAIYSITKNWLLGQTISKTRVLAGIKALI